MNTVRPFNPLSDLFVRALLGAEENKDLLISFVNAVFSEKGFNLVVSLNVLNPYNLTEYLNDKETILLEPVPEGSIWPEAKAAGAQKAQCTAGT